MEAEAVCVVADVFSGIVFAGFAAAKSVVSSMIQINNPMSFVFIYFTPIQPSNVPW